MTYLETQLGPQNLTMGGGPGPRAPPGSASVNLETPWIPTENPNMLTTFPPAFWMVPVLIQYHFCVHSFYFER